MKPDEIFSSGCIIDYVVIVLIVHFMNIALDKF